MPGDFVLAFWGMGNKAICDALPDMINVEPGIGYGVAFAEFRIYESYALMHANLGLDRVINAGNMPWHHVVIPNYFDTKDFEFGETKKDYFLCLGRINRGKGVDIALDITNKIGAKLVIAGQGEPVDLGLSAWPDHVEYVGYADVIKRRKLLKHAKGVFVLSTYLEPFCGVMIESFLSGTPVISTDWGTFTENNLHGLTGYRCRTFDHMVWAARNIHKIDAHTCRRWGENFTCNKVAPMYEEYFESINKCWYTVNNNRTNLDSIKRIFPSVNPCNIDAIRMCRI
jgi:glycosyltransferase involved in cell wall biosynthesis